MKEEYKEYYLFLEDLRKSGITNMFGASPYLELAFEELDEKSARNVLTNWMQNYNEIAETCYK